MPARSSIESVAPVVLVVCVLLAGCAGTGGGPSETVATSTEDERDTTAIPSPASPVEPTGTDGNRTPRDPTTRATTGTAETAQTGETSETSDTEGESGGGSTLLAGGTSRPALVTRVIDGDTVEVKYRDGETDTIRLLGVDTPEVSGDVSPREFEGVPDSAAGREHPREWATRASAFARDELSGAEVRIVTDPGADRRGRYGRLLAYVVRSDETDEGGGASEDGDVNRSGSFNAALLGEGYARVYESSFTRRERYERIEARTRRQGTGIWSFDDGDSEAGRTEIEGTSLEGSNPGLVVARLRADAPGDDNERPNGEYVVLGNRGSAELDLSGWRVTDEAGHTYVVSDGITLAPGARLTLYNSREADGNAELYWGANGRDPEQRRRHRDGPCGRQQSGHPEVILWRLSGV